MHLSPKTSQTSSASLGTSGRLPVEATSSLWWLAYTQVHEIVCPCWHRRLAVHAGRLRQHDSTGGVRGARAGLLAVGVRIVLAVGVPILAVGVRFPRGNNARRG